MAHDEPPLIFLAFNSLTLAAPPPVTKPSIFPAAEWWGSRDRRVDPFRMNLYNIIRLDRREHSQIIQDELMISLLD